MLLIIGGSSKIAKFIKGFFNEEFLFFTDKKKGFDYLLDLENLDHINFDNRISHAIFLAAITNIEYCNNNETKARMINGINTIDLIDRLNKKGIKVIFPSSTCVFSSNSKVENFEFSNTNADNIYGQIKAEVEKEILKNKLNTVLRISKIICPNDLLLTSWKNALKKKEKIFAFNDLRLAPTSVYSVAAYIQKWYKSDFNGIFHLSPSRDISYFQFAEKLASYMLVDKSLVKSESLVNSKKKIIYKPFKSYLCCTSPHSMELEIDNEIKKIFKGLI